MVGLEYGPGRASTEPQRLGLLVERAQSLEDESIPEFADLARLLGFHVRVASVEALVARRLGGQDSQSWALLASWPLDGTRTNTAEPCTPVTNVTCPKNSGGTRTRDVDAKADGHGPLGSRKRADTS